MPTDEQETPIVPRIVSAVGVCINATFSGNWVLADKIEKATVAAVQKVYDEGRGDDIDYMRERMAEARQQVETIEGYALDEPGAEAARKLNDRSAN